MWVIFSVATVVNGRATAVIITSNMEVFMGEGGRDKGREEEIGGGTKRYGEMEILVCIN